MLCVVFEVESTPHQNPALTLLGHTKQTHQKMVLFKKYDYEQVQR